MAKSNEVYFASENNEFGADPAKEPESLALIAIVSNRAPESYREGPPNGRLLPRKDSPLIGRDHANLLAIGR